MFLLSTQLFLRCLKPSDISTSCFSVERIPSLNVDNSTSAPSSLISVSAEHLSSSIRNAGNHSYFNTASYDMEKLYWHFWYVFLTCFLSVFYLGLIVCVCALNPPDPPPQCLVIKIWCVEQILSWRYCYSDFHDGATSISSFKIWCTHTVCSLSISRIETWPPSAAATDLAPKTSHLSLSLSPPLYLAGIVAILWSE